MSVEYAFKKGQEYEREKFIKELDKLFMSESCSYCDFEQNIIFLKKKLSK